MEQVECFGSVLVLCSRPCPVAMSLRRSGRSGTRSVQTLDGTARPGQLGWRGLCGSGPSGSRASSRATLCVDLRSGMRRGWVVVENVLFALSRFEEV